MARVGIDLKIMDTPVITLVFRAMGPLLFGIEPGVLQDWTQPECLGQGRVEYGPVGVPG